MAVVIRSLLKLEVTCKGKGASSRSGCSYLCPVQGQPTSHRAFIGKLDGEVDSG
ncbi:hypothetical protein I79_023872 [Cricetulus griseus]|uniref:Uncharacterized protein n=1 Tax=Cricetulus griseus TaxID=10029 RepID=G3IJ41_CRIGR|nr:hypothetical protein I79_023872 [Cricetulus griseus]